MEASAAILAMPPRYRRIIRSACDTLGVPFEDVFRKTRLMYPVEARSRGMRALRVQTSLSLTQIGQLFGGYDHTTVLHHIRKPDRDLPKLPPPPEPEPEPEPPIVIPPALAEMFASFAPRKPKRYLAVPEKLSLAQRLYYSERRAFARMLFILAPQYGLRPFSRFNVREPYRFNARKPKQ